MVLVVVVSTLAHTLSPTVHGFKALTAAGDLWIALAIEVSLGSTPVGAFNNGGETCSTEKLRVFCKTFVNVKRLRLLVPLGVQWPLEKLAVVSGELSFYKTRTTGSTALFGDARQYLRCCLSTCSNDDFAMELTGCVQSDHAVEL